MGDPLPLGTSNFRQNTSIFGQIRLALALFWTFLGQKFSAIFQRWGVPPISAIAFFGKKFCYKGAGGP